MNIEREYITLKELSSVWDISLEGTRKRLIKSGINLLSIPGKGKGGIVKAVYTDLLDIETQELIKNRKEGEKKAVSFADLTDFQRREIEKRYALLLLIEEYELKTGKKIEAIEYVLKNLSKLDESLFKKFKKIPSVRTVQRWFKEYRQNNDFKALAPQWGKKKGKTKLEQKEIFKKAYLDKKALKIRTIWMKYIMNCLFQKQAVINARDGWSSIKFSDGRILSYWTVYRYLSNISYPLQVLRREGLKAFNEKCIPAVDRDYSSLRANEVWDSDGHKTNVLVINDIYKDKDYMKPVRPVVVVWKDIRSRKIMGYSVDVSEKTETIWRALANSVRNNDYFLPKHILVDNGKAYKNKQSLGTEEFLGLYARLGVDKHFAIPYNAKAKPVETFWRWFDNYISKSLPAYTGSNNQNKPESCNADVKQGRMLKLSEFIEIVAEQIEVYNNMPHSGKDMAGKSPAQMFEEEMIETKQISDKEFATVFLQRKKAKVYRDGIRFMGYIYRDKLGEYSLYQSKEIVIAFDEKDFSNLYAFDTSGKYLFTLYKVERTKWMLDEDVNSMEEYRKLYSEKKKVRRHIQAIEEYKANKTREFLTSVINEEKEIEKKGNVSLPWAKTNLGG